jgi:hypothetical protein
MFIRSCLRQICDEPCADAMTGLREEMKRIASVARVDHHRLIG